MAHFDSIWNADTVHWGTATLTTSGSTGTGVGYRPPPPVEDHQSKFLSDMMVKILAIFGECQLCGEQNNSLFGIDPDARFSMFCAVCEQLLMEARKDLMTKWLMEMKEMSVE